MRFFSTLTACAASLLAMTSTTFANPVAQSSSIGGAANTPFSGQPIGSGLPSTYGLSNSATPNASPAKLVKRGNIGYNNGGTILTGNRNVYACFYGNWASSDQSIINDFISGVSTSSWWRVVQQYYQTSSGSKSFVGTISLGGSNVDASYALGKAISGTDKSATIVQNAISRGLPNDPSGIYVVLTSSDVTESSSIGTYCVNYCGWHYSFSWNGQTYVYAFVGNPGNPSTCPSGCNTVNKSISPNNSPAVDTMVNQMAHEIVEAVTDPYGGAWTDGNGGEAGDVCAYNYGGPNLRTRNGYFFNAGWGKRAYLIQWIWSPNSNNCRYAP